MLVYRLFLWGSFIQMLLMKSAVMADRTPFYTASEKTGEERQGFGN